MTKTKVDTKQDLEKKVAQLRSDLIEHSKQLRLGSSSNVRKGRQLRRQIARLLTSLRQEQGKKGAK